MHTIHHVRGVIVRSQPSGEYNKLVWLFTRELGIVVATVTGVRKPGAKLQPQLIDYAFLDADLVKGRDVWRLVSATVVSDPLFEKTHDLLARPYVRALGILDRFLIGEGEHPEIFDDIEAGAALVGSGDIDAKSFDTVLIWRILTRLGHTATDSDDESLITQPFVDVLQNISASKITTLIKTVNEAIAASHL